MSLFISRLQATGQTKPVLNRMFRPEQTRSKQNVYVKIQKNTKKNNNESSPDQMFTPDQTRMLRQKKTGAEQKCSLQTWTNQTRYKPWPVAQSQFQVLLR